MLDFFLAVMSISAAAIRRIYEQRSRDGGIIQNWDEYSAQNPSEHRLLNAVGKYRDTPARRWYNRLNGEATCHSFMI